MKIQPRPLLPTTTEKTRPAEGTLPATSRQGTRFEALLSKRDILSRRSLRSDVEQPATATGINPELFGSTRSLEILEYLLQHVLPSLDAEPEIKMLAQDLIREEIHMRRTLEQQLAEVQA